MRRPAPVLAGALACLALGPGCILPSTQRWPAPMEIARKPLLPGDSEAHPPGPEEVTLLRHADPVHVRPAGALSGYPLAFYDKQARLSAGAAVVVSAGGRAEILWPNATSITMFGRGIGWVGSPSRGEPLFELTDVDMARMVLAGETVRLLGGALLSGTGGPYVLERTGEETLLVQNQSQGMMSVAYREETFELGPGQGVILPLVSTGTAPRSAESGLQTISGPGFSVLVGGGLVPAETGSGVLLRGDGDPLQSRAARGLGVEVHLAPGEEALFSGLGRPAPEPAPPPKEAPAAGEPAEVGSPAIGVQRRSTAGRSSGG
jgi:hypothetical protein